MVNATKTAARRSKPSGCSRVRETGILFAENLPESVLSASDLCMERSDRDLR